MSERSEVGFYGLDGHDPSVLIVCQFLLGFFHVPDGNTSMACNSSCHNIHIPDDCMVVHRFSSIWSVAGCTVVWMDMLSPVY